MLMNALSIESLKSHPAERLSRANFVDWSNDSSNLILVLQECEEKSGLLHLSLSGALSNPNTIGKLDDLEVSELVRLLTPSEVTSVDLRYNLIGEIGAARIAQQLQMGWRLKHLDLSYNSLTSDAVLSLSKAISPGDTKLYSLHLAGNKIGSKGAITLAWLLQQSGNGIKELDLGHTDQSVDSLTHIFVSLTVPECRLQKLILDNPLIPVAALDDVADLLARALQVNDTLHVLSIKYFQFGDSQMEILADSLSRHKSLVCLDMSANWLHTGSMDIFAIILRHNRILRAISVAHNQIGSEGLIQLAQSVMHSAESIKLINVRHNKATCEGLLPLINCMALSKLDTLYFWGNKLGSKTCELVNRLMQRGVLKPEQLDVRPYSIDCAPHLAEDIFEKTVSSVMNISM